MNLQCIAEHTVDLSLLTRGSKVLDLGCREFTWSKAMLEYVDEVWCVDADPDVKVPESPLKLIRGAVLAYDDQPVYLKQWGNGTGNKVYEQCERRPNGKYVEARSITIKTISEIVRVKIWDVIKFDIEGSEIGVLLSLDVPPSKQLSIEFHIHTGTPNQNVDKAVKYLESLGYQTVQHELSAQHGAGINYWDSLFILKQ